MGIADAAPGEAGARGMTPRQEGGDGVKTDGHGRLRRGSKVREVAGSRVPTGGVLESGELSRDKVAHRDELARGGLNEALRFFGLGHVVIVPSGCDISEFWVLSFLPLSSLTREWRAPGFQDAQQPFGAVVSPLGPRLVGLDRNSDGSDRGTGGKRQGYAGPESTGVKTAGRARVSPWESSRIGTYGRARNAGTPFALCRRPRRKKPW